MDAKTLLLQQYRWDCAISRHMLGVLTSDLSEDELNWQARPGHHSIWHHIWHVFLSNDYYFANAIGVPAVWEAGNWRAKIDLAPMARAFEQEGNAAEGPVPRFTIADVPDSLVDELKAVPLEQYFAYIDDLFSRTTATLETTSEEQLDGRLTQYGRRMPVWSVAVNFDHVYRHIGMMEDVRGLIRGPGQGTASI